MTDSSSMPMHPGKVKCAHLVRSIPPLMLDPAMMPSPSMLLQTTTGDGVTLLLQLVLVQQRSARGEVMTT